MIYNRCEYCISFKTLGVTDVSATDDDCISVEIYIHAQTGLINWKAKVEVTGNQPIIGKHLQAQVYPLLCRCKPLKCAGKDPKTSAHADIFQVSYRYLLYVCTGTCTVQVPVLKQVNVHSKSRLTQFFPR